MVGIGFGGSHNPERPVAVAEGERNGFFHEAAVAGYLFGIRKLDVSRRVIQVENAAQHQLQRTALGPDNQVDAFGVGLHLVLQLVENQ